MTATLVDLAFNNYMKKPVEVQAAKLTEDTWAILRNQPNHVMYVSGRQLCATEENGEKYFLIDTLEGLMRGEIGDMLIIGVKGEIYACKPDIFEQTYNEVQLDKRKEKIMETMIDITDYEKKLAIKAEEATEGFDMGDDDAVQKFQSACVDYVKAWNTITQGINTVDAQEAFVRFIFSHMYNVGECLGTYQHLIDETKEI